MRHSCCLKHFIFFEVHELVFSPTNVSLTCSDRGSCSRREIQDTSLLLIWPFSLLSLFKLPPFCLLLFFPAKFYLGDFQSRTHWSSSTGARTAFVCCYLSKMVKAKNSRRILGGKWEKIWNSFIYFFSPLPLPPAHSLRSLNLTSL